MRQFIQAILALSMIIIGYVFIFQELGLKVTIGIALLVWGNNVENKYFRNKND